jgi:hypothetical protein
MTRAVRLIPLALTVALLLSPFIVQAQNAAVPDEIVPLRYPDRITPIRAPLNVALRYGAHPKKPFRTEIVWGPDNAPGLYAMRAAGTVSASLGADGIAVEMQRSPTQVAFGPRLVERPDGGMVKATIDSIGGFKFFELHLPDLDGAHHRRQFSALGGTLIDTGRVPPFKRLSVRTGPDDTAGSADTAREKKARADLLEALQPLLGMVLELPPAGVSTGDRLVLIRRDLGDLFRSAQPIPLRVEGEVQGLAEYDDRRFLVLKLDRAELARPMRANIDGYALIDIATALPETVIASIELVILVGTDTTVFRFVERRVMVPADVPGQP